MHMLDAYPLRHLTLLSTVHPDLQVQITSFRFQHTLH